MNKQEVSLIERTAQFIAERTDKFNQEARLRMFLGVVKKRRMYERTGGQKAI